MTIESVPHPLFQTLLYQNWIVPVDKLSMCHHRKREGKHQNTDQLQATHHGITGISGFFDYVYYMWR